MFLLKCGQSILITLFHNAVPEELSFLVQYSAAENISDFMGEKN
jgi:hypothetical protein